MVYWKTPEFHDEFRIKDEAMYSARVLTCLILYYLIYNVLTGTEGESWGFWFSLQIVSTLLPFITSMVVTYWVLKIENRMRFLNNVKSNPNVLEIGSQNSNFTDTHHVVTSLEDVLADDRGFEGFMQHLATEWSMENLLSVIEMTQYQQFILYYHKKKAEAEKEKEEKEKKEKKEKEKEKDKNNNMGRSGSLRVHVAHFRSSSKGGSQDSAKQYGIVPDDIDVNNSDNSDNEMINVKYKKMYETHTQSPSLQVPTNDGELGRIASTSGSGGASTSIETTTATYSHVSAESTQEEMEAAVQSIDGLADLALKMQVSESNIMAPAPTNNNNNNNTNSPPINAQSSSGNNNMPMGTTQLKHRSSKDNVKSKFVKFATQLQIQKSRNSTNEREIRGDLIGLVLIQLPDDNVIPRSSLVWDEYEKDVNNVNDADAEEAVDQILANFDMDPDEKEREEEETDKNDNDNNENENVIKVKSLREYLEAIAIALFEKYIEPNSEFELNISSRLRRSSMKKKKKLLDKCMTDEELFHIFDKIIKAMMKLMIDSFVRFKLTDGFRAWESNFLKKDNSNITTVTNLIGKIATAATKSSQDVFPKKTDKDKDKDNNTK